jgi:glycosyltransferase involved in cell wall biosynthesis
MEQRLASVFAQSYPVREVVVLDDASTDDSVARASATAASWSRDITIIENPKNSGSAFASWHRAATLARGDFLWIAEADDAAEPDFLAALAAAMQRAPDVELAFSDSRAISSTGGEIWPDYKGYYAESDALALHRDGIFAADEFARRFLSERNLILNVSAVLWRRASLLAALERCAEDLTTYRMAGDWRLHVELLAGSTGTVAYVARPLNLHRRHAASVTALADGARHAAEIARVQAVVRKRVSGGEDLKRRQGAYVRAVKKNVGARPQTPQKA